MVSVNDLSARNFALFMYQAAHDPFISLSGRGAYNRQSKHEKMYTYPFSFRVNFIIIVHMYIICLRAPGARFTKLFMTELIHKT